jgi:type I restriction enzyme R subunit
VVHGGMTEAEIEDAALDYFRALGYRTMTGPESAPDAAHPVRAGYDQVILTGLLREAAARINPSLPATVVDQAITQLSRAESQNPLIENERVHRLLTDGVPVEHRGADGATRTSLVWLVD